MRQEKPSWFKMRLVYKSKAPTLCGNKGKKYSLLHITRWCPPNSWEKRALEHIADASKAMHSSPHSPFPLAHITNWIPCGMEYLFGQFESADLAVPPLKVSPTPSLLVKGQCWRDILGAAPELLSNSQGVINTFLLPTPFQHCEGCCEEN